MDGLEPLGVKGEGVVKWTGCATSDGSKWTAQSDDGWKVVEVVKVISVTQDCPKWTASTERIELWRVLEGKGERRWLTLLTALNGRSGAWQGGEIEV